MDRTLQSIVRSMPQPYGGYLKVAQFQTTDLTRGHPKSIDVLTLPEPTVLYTLFIRYLQLKDGYSADVAFSNAFKGIRSDVRSRLTKLVNSVQEVTTSKSSTKSLCALCELSYYDALSAYSGLQQPRRVIRGASLTTRELANIRALIQCADEFCAVFGRAEHYGCLVGCTAGSSHVGCRPPKLDIITADTIWYVTVTRTRFTSDTSLYLYMAYRLALNLGYHWAEKITHIGVVNPIKGIASTHSLASVPGVTFKDTQAIVSRLVLSSNDGCRDTCNK